MERIFNQQRPKLRSLLLVLLCTTFIASPVLAASEAPEETLAWCESLAIEASEMAFEAQVTCDYPTVHQALNLADEAAYLLSKVSKMARETANPRLALSTYNVCNQVEAAIANVIRAAQYIVSHNPNSDVVHAANVLLDLCESEKKGNKVSMEIALAPLSSSSVSADGYSN